MSEHKIPRELPSEPFTAFNSSEGKSKPIRELDDQKLQLALEATQNQRNQLKVTFASVLREIINVERAEALFSYEIDRRAKSLTVVHSLNGLRRQ